MPKNVTNIEQQIEDNFIQGISLKVKIALTLRSSYIK